MKILTAVLFVNMMFLSCAKMNKIPDYKTLIDQGEFARAEKIIMDRLQNKASLTQAQKREMIYELERMRRIRKDFTQTRQEVVEFIRKYIPDVSDQDILSWEKEKSLESMVIDGQKRYFNHAARNLFRINPRCREIWEEAHAGDPKKEVFALDEHNRSIVHAATSGHSPYVKPVRLHIKYTITVKPDQVPDGETVRCWIPFPREIPHRQTDIELIATTPATHFLAPADHMQRTVYLEQTAHKGQPARFSVEYAYTSHGVYVEIDPQKVTVVRPNEELKRFLEERPPHIVFTPQLKELSRKIVGSETNPYRIAQKLFAWIDENIPWASAREYSTIRNISMYAYENRHGDCGIQTMLFITLCRLNGIPARWQSGWEFQPPKDSMHDWGMIYFEPYGWVPMDVTYGLRDVPETDPFRWFYLHGMDSYRLIFNDDFSSEFVPPKDHLRSETVDSQRGEVEWRGGNLYFDQWDWQMEWRVLSQ